MNRTLMSGANVSAITCLLIASLTAAESHAAVGSTTASYSVTQNGAAVYTIPIRATEGIGALTPRLAINYVGPGQRTILGVGFALSGISYITPCRKTIVQDVSAAPVTLTAADRFCLDGARLRAVAGTGTYGASNTKYRTELDRMIRATSLESNNGIPGWFKVEMPNGLEYEYGHTDDSRLRANSLSYAPPQFWAVNRIKDANGNSIEFVYDTDHGLRRFRPNYILYTMRGTAANYRINFVYQAGTQPEPTVQYTPSAAGGAAHKEDKLLDHIDLLHEDSVYLRYKLLYQDGAGENQRLQYVTECAVVSGVEDCLLPIQLAWQSATSGHEPETPTIMNNFALKTIDINGDGVDDLVGYTGGTWHYALGNASGGYGTVMNTGVAAINPNKARPIEWDGDGRWDLLIDWSDGKWRVLRGTENGLSTSPLAAGPGAGVSSNLYNNQSMTIADVNGDGRDDYITMTLDAYIALVVRFNSPTGLGSAAVVYQDYGVRALGNGFSEEGGSSAYRRPDFNGDSKSDLMIYGCVWEPDIYPSGECVATGWFQFVATGSSFFNYGYLPYASYGVGIRFADVNGDGLTDVIYPAQTPGQWYTAFGQGDSYLVEVPGPSFSGYLYFMTLIGDYDADGIDDFYAAHVGSGTWHVFRGSSNGLTSSPIETGISTSCTNWTMMEATGDDLTDLGCYNSSNGNWKIFAHSGLPGERLASATDGLGNQVAFSYLPMTDTTVYAKGTGATFPSRDYRGTVPLVRTMQISPAGGSAYAFTYKYANARVHAQGRSFLGMGKREITDGRNGLFAVETYRQDFPYVGAPDTVTVKQSSAEEAKTIQDVAHSYSHHELDPTSGNQRYLPVRIQTVTNSYEVGGVKNGNLISDSTETHAVNKYGNSTFIAIDAKDMDSGSPEFNSTYRTEISSSYIQSETPWCIGLPLSRSENRILPGGINETRTAEWQVAAAECRVTQETIQPNSGALTLVTDVDYDTCGNVSSISSYPAGQPGEARNTQIGYGTRCQRPESVTNPEGETSALLYDWPRALPSRLSDPNGIYSDMEYDGFGRLTRRINPDLTATRFLLTACDAGNDWCGKNGSARIKFTQSVRNTSDAILRADEQFQDGFGRMRWSHSDSLESGPSIVQTDYDAFGRPIAQSQPHFLGGTVYATIYTRDLIGRVTQVNAPIDEGNPIGRTTLFAYEGRDLKVTDPKNFTTTRRSNVIGQLRKVIDPLLGEPTTAYTYHPFGELASITDAAGNITSWNYNLRGFLEDNTDPDSGFWEYLHNAFGEMNSQTDAKEQETFFTYDKLGRPLTRTEDEGTTTFTYGQLSDNTETAKYIGRLKTVQSPGGYREDFLFDYLGRLLRKRTKIDGINYDVNLTYLSTTGLVNRLRYPISTNGERFEVQYQYQNHLLKRVKEYQGTTTYWEANSTNAFGQIRDELFGNGVQTVTEFDRASGLMKARQASIGSTALIDAALDWDLNGNLAYRQDLLLGLTETFDFDNLNRFNASELNGAPNAGVRLNEIGNILWKKDVCPTSADCYAFHATKKRAVVSAGNFSFGYDDNGNMNSRNGSSIGYTSYNLPSVINAGGSSTSLFYGAFRDRYKQVAQSATGTETTLYVAGLLEIVTRGSLIEYRHYIVGGKGAAAIHTRRAGSSTTSDTVYLHRDHLGSPELITDAAGEVLVRLSFGAYGERRDGDDWAEPLPAGDLTAIANLSRRGFTGHEHLDAVGLIHMNGRVYEPVAGRFLSVDPLIDGFDSSQGSNSYAYVHNNPLTFTDPFGLSHNCDDDAAVACPPHDDDDFWDGVFECQGWWMAGWSPDCENQFFLGPQGNEVVDITGGGQTSRPLTPDEAWDGVISGGAGVEFGAGSTVSGFFLSATFTTQLGTPFTDEEPPALAELRRRYPEWRQMEDRLWEASLPQGPFGGALEDYGWGRRAREHGMFVFQNSSGQLKFQTVAASDHARNSIRGNIDIPHGYELIAVFHTHPWPWAHGTGGREGLRRGPSSGNPGPMNDDVDTARRYPGAFHYIRALGYLYRPYPYETYYYGARAGFP